MMNIWLMLTVGTGHCQHRPYGHHGCDLVEKVVSNILNIP